MVAVEGNFGYSFLLGVFAAVNPCGFVMLPAYLTYFLGVDATGANGADRRASVGRALAVSGAVSAGFVFVFTVIGVLVRQIAALRFLVSEAKWAGLVIGIAMIVGGTAMLFGWTPTFSSARLSPSVKRDRSVRSMFLFGAAYAVASIGCTIGLFLSAILGSFTRDGVASGALSIALYGVGMGMLVTALTVTLAVAKTGFTDRLRSGMRHAHTVAAVVVILTGMYLAWYWFGAIFRADRTDAVTGLVGGWQSDLVSWMDHYGATSVAVTLSVVLLVALLAASRRMHREPDSTDSRRSRRRAEHR